MMSKKPMSVYLDDELVEMIDWVVQVRRMGGHDANRSTVVAEALTLFVRNHRDVLVADGERVLRQMDAYQAALESI